MSVKTRSQLKSTMNFQPVKQDLVVWFKKMIINYCDEIDALSNKLKYMTNGIEYKKILYDRMRLVTEVFYNVHQYLPELYESSVSVIKDKLYKGIIYLLLQKIKDKLYKGIKTIYNRIQNYYDENQRILINYSPLDNIEFNIIKTTYEQLYETEKMCIQYLKPNDLLRRPRRCPYKNYIGMDKQQYDYITDYWYEEIADTDTDSDYDPENEEDYEEDEKDDEEYEKYVVTEDEEDEDEEYIDEKEDKRILRKDKKAENEIYKVIHQSNKNKNDNKNTHIRFID